MSVTHINPEFKTVLVTGGGGYVGSHTIVELLNNYSVIVVDNLKNCYAEPECKPESLKRVEKITGKSVDFYEIDIRNAKNLDAIFKKVFIPLILNYSFLSTIFIA